MVLKNHADRKIRENQSGKAYKIKENWVKMRTNGFNQGLSSKMCKFLIFPYRQFSKLPILYARINTVHTSECVPAFCRP